MAISIKNLTGLCMALFCSAAMGQHLATAVPDSLVGKSFEYLINRVTHDSGDSNTTRVYLRAWSVKAKALNDYHQLSAAYRLLSFKSEEDARLLYADSMIAAAKEANDRLLIGKAYLTRGIILYDKKNLSSALDNYLIADKYISGANDDDAKYMVRYTIALTKYYLGFYDEAIAIFDKCLKYYYQTNDRAYVNTIHSLAICHNKIGNFDQATELNDLGLKACRDYGISAMESYLTQSEGINQFSKGNYTTAVLLLSAAWPAFLENKDFAAESVTAFYLGKCYLQLRNNGQAINFFKKVDRIFQDERYIRADEREAYEHLINFYRQKQDTDSQLIYMKRLLEVDSTLMTNYKYLYGKLVKEYDTKEIQEAIAAIKQRDRIKTIAGMAVILVLAAIIFFLMIRYRKERELNRMRFEELMAGHQRITHRKTSPMKEAINEINPEVVAMVTKNMQQFEKRKDFLKKDLTQVKLAELLNTNTRYIPKIVLHVTGKSTIDYICDLKIDYIVERLKSDKRFRNYTNKALGEEAGFGSTQNFTRAFKTRTGISPTYFIAELKALDVQNES